MTIRPAKAWDVPAITRIYNEAVAERSATADTEPRSLADRRKWFQQFDAKHPIFIGEEDGEVVAYGCLFAYSPKEGYRLARENSVYVAGSARGRGWGKKMLSHLILRARTLRLRYLWARIFAHNKASLALHRTLGFARVGRQKKVACMDGRWYDVVLLDKHL